MCNAMNVTQALLWAESALQGSDSPGLEAQVLLAHVMQVSRLHFLAWPERDVSDAVLQQFQAVVARRVAAEPIAYITGEKEFWSLSLRVTPDTLIPRPETEGVVEQALEKLDPALPQAVLDLGTGSGAIALALAKERPHWSITATDASMAALVVAKENAQRLQIVNVNFIHSDWFVALGDRLFDVIVSNPPYIAVGDPDLAGAVKRSEPSKALFAAESGLAAIKIIIAGSQAYLKPGGCLILEHGFRQAIEVQQLLQAAGFEMITTYADLAGLDRVTVGRKVVKS